MQQLQPRREVCEYGLLPLHALCPQLDSTSTLINLHGKLLSGSTQTTNGEGTTTASHLASVFELTNTQTEVLCEVLSSLSVKNSSPDTQSRETIYVHELSMFLLAQLFSREAQRPDSVEYWPDAGPSFTSFDLLSPTRQMVSRSPSAGKTMLRQQLQQYLRNQTHALRGFGDYLRRNLRTILELSMDQPPAAGDQTQISAREVDRMAFLLQPPRNRQGVRLSSLVGAFSSSAQLPLDTVVNALKQSWFEETLDSPRMASFSSSTSSPSPKAIRHLGLVGPSGQVDDSKISGVHKGSVVRGETDVPGGMLHISDCHDSVIYILAPLQAAIISSCSDCTIVLGAVGRTLRIERLDKVQLHAATTRTVVSSCHDCTLFLGTPRPPVLIGDNRFLKVAPLNTRYERQPAHLAAAGVSADLPNKWDSPIVLVGKDRRVLSSSGCDSPRTSSLSSQNKPPFTLLPPEDFLPFVVPFQGSSGVLAGGPAPPHATRWSHMASGKVPLYVFPLPPEYERALHKKLNMTNDLRQKFKQAGLTKEKERELNDAIQAYFKEWLSSSSMLRQIYDLSNLEKDESSGDQRERVSLIL